MTKLNVTFIVISIFVGKNNESVHWNCNLCSEGLCAHSRTVTYTVFLHSTLSYPLHLQYMHVDDWALLVSLTNLASISAPCQSINLITVRSLSRKIIVSYWSLPAELTLLPFFAVLPIGRLQCWSTGNMPNKPCIRARVHSIESQWAVACFSQKNTAIYNLGHKLHTTSTLASPRQTQPCTM